MIRERTVLWVLASQKHCLFALSWLSVTKLVAPCIVFKDRLLNTKCVRENRNNRPYLVCTQLQIRLLAYQLWYILMSIGTSLCLTTSRPSKSIHSRLISLEQRYMNPGYEPCQRRAGRSKRRNSCTSATRCVPEKRRRRPGRADHPGWISSEEAWT